MALKCMVRWENGTVRKDIQGLHVNRNADILHSALNVKINVTATGNFVIIKLGVYRLPIVRMDILGNTVKNSVLFQNMGTAANKAAYVQDHNAILLLDARVNKTATIYIIPMAMSF
ncbi:uncharacterized protein LOC144620958 [Crassostrea virginica]